MQVEGLKRCPAKQIYHELRGRSSGWFFVPIQNHSKKTAFPSEIGSVDHLIFTSDDKHRVTALGRSPAPSKWAPRAKPGAHAVRARLRFVATIATEFRLSTRDITRQRVERVRVPFFPTPNPGGRRRFTIPSFGSKGTNCPSPTRLGFQRPSGSQANHYIRKTSRGEKTKTNIRQYIYI